MKLGTLIMADGLFPNKCPACLNLIEETDNKDSPESSFCSICKITLTEILSPICKQCGLPLPADQGQDVTCLKCLKNPPYFDSVTSKYLYGAAIRDVIERFKFHGATHLADPLSQIMLSASHFSSIPKVSTVIPVPLHLRKLFNRGYNQSALLAKKIAKHLKIPFEPQLLKRIKNTKSQLELDFSEREKNVRSAFQIRKNIRLDNINVLLVDDILTTGATASACAMALKKHGAKQVHVLTIARTVT